MATAAPAAAMPSPDPALVDRPLVVGTRDHDADGDERGALGDLPPALPGHMIRFDANRRPPRTQRSRPGALLDRGRRETVHRQPLPLRRQALDLRQSPPSAAHGHPDARHRRCLSVDHRTARRKSRRTHLPLARWLSNDSSRPRTPAAANMVRSRWAPNCSRSPSSTPPNCRHRCTARRCATHCRSKARTPTPWSLTETRTGIPQPLGARDVETATACALALSAFLPKHAGIFQADSFTPVCESYFDDDDREVRFTVPYEAIADFKLNEPAEQERDAYLNPTPPAEPFQRWSWPRAGVHGIPLATRRFSQVGGLRYGLRASLVTHFESAAYANSGCQSFPVSFIIRTWTGRDSARPPEPSRESRTEITSRARRGGRLSLRAAHGRR